MKPYCTGSIIIKSNGDKQGINGARFILYSTANVTSDEKFKLLSIFYFLQHLCCHFFFTFINHHITKTAIMEGTACRWREDSNYM